MRLIFILLFASLFAQAQEQTVLVDVLVRGKTGAVAGLTKDDFILKDKGKTQKIDIFAATPAHDADFKPSPLGAGVGANRLNWRGEPLRAATIILFDHLNTPTQDQAFARLQVLAMLASLKETDTVAFVSLSRTLLMVHDFTSDPSLLIRTAKRMNTANAAPATDPAEIEMQKKIEMATAAMPQIDEVARPPLTASAFHSVALHLMGLQGRKSLIWIARSFPLTFGADVNRRNETANELVRTTAILQEGNVAVYPVSPGGVGSGFDDTSSRSDRQGEGRLMPNANVAQNSGGALGDASNLQGIADATGGKAFNNLNDLIPVIRAVLDESELTYTLGFHTETRGAEEQLHGLDVDLVKGKGQGAAVRFRKKYLATRRNVMTAGTMPQLAVEPFEATAIGIAAAAQLDPAKTGSQKVEISVNPGDLTMTHEGDKWNGGFDLGLFVDGTPLNTATGKTFNLSFTDEQWKKVLAGGLVIDGSIPVKAAGDVIHVIVRERGTGAAGSVRVPAR